MNKKRVITIVSGVLILGVLLIYIIMGRGAEAAMQMKMATTVIEFLICEILFAALIGDEKNTKEIIGKIFAAYIFALGIGFITILVKDAIADHIAITTAKGIVDSVLMFFFWRYILCIDGNQRKYSVFNILMCVIMGADFVNAALYPLSSGTIISIESDGNLIHTIIKVVYFGICTYVIIRERKTVKRMAVFFAYSLAPIAIGYLQFFLVNDRRDCECVLAIALLNYFVVHKNRIKEIDDRNTDMETAVKIREATLISKREDCNEFDAFAVSKSAKEVGADFYDYYLIDKTHLLFMIGNVSGEGTPSTLFMVKTMNAVKRIATKTKKSSEIMTLANRELCESNDDNFNVELWLGILDLKTGKLRYVNAGYISPILISKYGASYIESQPDIALGTDPDAKFTQKEIAVEESGGIVLYSEGVAGATNANGDSYGSERLNTFMQTLIDKDSQKIVESVMKDIAQYSQVKSTTKDMAMLVLRFHRGRF